MYILDTHTHTNNIQYVFFVHYFLAGDFTIFVIEAERYLPTLVERLEAVADKCGIGQDADNPDDERFGSSLFRHLSYII